MRLPYVSDPPPFTSDADNEIVQRIRQRRGERGLISLDRALLHSPPVANGWNTLLGAIRTSTTLSASIKETAISRVAVLNKAWYEFEHHAPLLLRDGALPLAGLKYILTAESSTKTRSPHAVNNEIGVDEQHALVLEYTDYMTLDCEVPDEVFARLKGAFNEREIVEVTATVGSYNCVSRFLVALNVSERNGPEGMREALKHVSPELEKLTPVSR
jgi:alkylhydroperoxidase family enzyme